MAVLLEAVQQTLAERKHDNLIRLLVGETVCYDDREGAAGDLDRALAAADPARLAHADRLQLVVEEEDDEELLYILFNIQVYRRHAPGTFPLWLRVTALEKELLRREGEKPRQWQERLRALLGDRAELLRRRERDLACLSRVLESLRDGLSTRLAIEATRIGAFLALQPAPDDYYFSLRPEYWDTAQLLGALAEEVELPADLQRASSKPLREFVADHEQKLADLERTLLPEGARGLGSGAKSWTEFSKRRVFNPRSGRVAMIRSLSREAQQPYRQIFNRAAPGDEQVETTGLAGRLLGRVRRGIGGELAATLDGLRDKAPRTYAFLQDRAFRKKLYGRSARLLGEELVDLADTLAHTVVRELVQTGKLPLAWYKGNKVMMSEADHAAAEAAHQQMLDLAELTVGTLIPLGGFAAGGPLGGAVALAGIKLFQRALNWHSKKSGGREWTILPDTWHQRGAELDAERAPEREKQQRTLDRAAADVARHRKQEQRQAMVRLQRELAENFRDFGLRLAAGEVKVDDELLDVSTLPQGPIQAALAEEAGATR